MSAVRLCTVDIVPYVLPLFMIFKLWFSIWLNPTYNAGILHEPYVVVRQGSSVSVAPRTLQARPYSYLSLYLYFQSVSAFTSCLYREKVGSWSRSLKLKAQRHGRS